MPDPTGGGTRVPMPKAELDAHALDKLAGRLVAAHGITWALATSTVLNAAAMSWRLPEPGEDLTPWVQDIAPTPAKRDTPKPTRQQRRDAAKNRRST